MNPASRATSVPTKPLPPPPPPPPPPRADRGGQRSFAEALSRGRGAPDDPPEANTDERVASPQGDEVPEPRLTEEGPPAPTSPGATSTSTPTKPVDPSSDDDQVTAPAPRRAHDELLDPSSRHVAQLAPLFQSPEAPAAAPVASVETATRPSLESMLPELVRKIAWSGDGRRGSMRLELGAGSLSGGTLTVHADAGRVRVELDAPAGTDVAAWKARLSERLAQRGVEVDEIVVE